jgi:hypothetical protein
VSDVQLSFDDLQLKAVSTAVPAKITNLIPRWRRLLRCIDPHADEPVKPSVFQLVGDKLADHADRHGRRCYPTIEQLAAETRLGKRTVQRALVALERRRLIDRNTKGGRGRATEYVLRCPEIRPRAVPPQLVRDRARELADSPFLPAAMAASGLSPVEFAALALEEQ